MASSRRPKDDLTAALPSDDLSWSENAESAPVDASGTVASGESEHALLLAGKIGREEFMDMTVDRALSPLVGRVSTGRLNVMRDVLRSQLADDPHLSSLVRQASGAEA